MIKKIKDKLFKKNAPADDSLQVATTIVMYATRFCPYCVRARNLFSQKGWEYQEISVDNEPALREEMMRKSARHTVPQIWIGDLHVGGCDELIGLELNGQLDALVTGTD